MLFKFALAIIFSVLFTFNAFSDEGMWLPHLLKQLNEKDMKAMGFKLSADDIYSVNKKSMKDAVVLFGRGCTGEVISNEGLLLTNHHCGFGQIQDHSDVSHDYLTNGFWAKERKDELRNPGLTVTFIIEVKDVTAEILKSVTSNMSESERENAITAASLPLIAKAVEGSHYEAIIKPMFGGNEYLLFVTETFKDVRLVGAPPMHIGNFGKDSDNWTWPRHTGDFSMFRIYAGKDNKPADYSPDNIPFQPRHFFPISLKGVKENDFTMVYGFPARTNEYLHSEAVDLTINHSSPVKVALRDVRLKTMKASMDTNQTIFIQYADKYSGVANYWKKWAGEAKGLKKADAITRKKVFENKFDERTKTQSNLLEYDGLTDKLGQLYLKLKPIQLELDLFSDGILSNEILRYANNFNKLYTALQENKKEQAQAAAADLSKNVDPFFKDYNKLLDARLIAQSFYQVYQIKPNFIAPEQVEIIKQEKDIQKWDVWALQQLNSSYFQSKAMVKELLNKTPEVQLEILQKDVIFQMALFYYSYYRNQVLAPYNEINSQITSLNRKYIQAQRLAFPNKKFYPDANQTLRVAFGKAEGYQPSDAVNFSYFTTADGILEKNNNGATDHKIDERLRTLIQNKDFGRYADKKTKKLHTCFAASNHTTGGNSGSPVLNAYGQLIGTNFDRNWEGTMSDIFYDINQVRNITLDIRYTLWVIDKYAGASHLLNEMEIIE